MDRYRCEDCTLWFESHVETARCEKCASRLGEGATTPSPTNSTAPAGTGMWNGWSWFHGPGKVPHLLPAEANLDVPITLSAGGVYYFNVAVGLDKPDLYGMYFAPICVNKMAEDFRAMVRLQEDAIVQALMIPAHLIAPAFVAKPNLDGVADLKAHLSRWVADKCELA